MSKIMVGHCNNQECKCYDINCLVHCSINTITLNKGCKMAIIEEFEIESEGES